MDTLNVLFKPDALRRLRGDRSKAEMARAVGVTHQVYSNWEAGQIPGGDNVFRLVRLFGRAVLDDLFEIERTTPAATSAVSVDAQPAAA